MSSQPNPLAKHFRQPSIYITLPSGGRYWADGSIMLPANGEIPVYSMTARDEITIRTPDALLNGQGVIDVIQSCCPAVKDAWKMPSIDVDAILIAIRIASYGNGMEIESTCPNCETEHAFDLDLGGIRSTIKCPDYSQPLIVDDLSIELRPQQYFDVNRASQITFAEQQILRTVNDDTMTEEQKTEINDRFLERLVDLNIDICTNSTQSITVDGIKVTNADHIREFYENAEYRIIKQVQAKLQEISREAIIQPIKYKCENCQHEYYIPVAFDYSSFFEQGF